MRWSEDVVGLRGEDGRSRRDVAWGGEGRLARMEQARAGRPGDGHHPDSHASAFYLELDSSPFCIWCYVLETPADICWAPPMAAVTSWLCQLHLPQVSSRVPALGQVQVSFPLQWLPLGRAGAGGGIIGAGCCPSPRTLLCPEDAKGAGRGPGHVHTMPSSTAGIFTKTASKKTHNKTNHLCQRQG